MKATHLNLRNTPHTGINLIDDPNDLCPTDWRKNWQATIGDTIIVANGSRSLVEYSYTLAGKEVVEFDGSARAGLERRMRETIACNLGVDYRDIILHQREVRI